MAQNLCDIFGVATASLQPRAISRSEKDQILWKDTPLWIASATGCTESVILLMKQGAWIFDSGGCEVSPMTPLEIAVAENRLEIVELLTVASDSLVQECSLMRDCHNLVAAKEESAVSLDWFLWMSPSKADYYLSNPTLCQVQLVSTFDAWPD